MSSRLEDRWQSTRGSKMTACGVVSGTLGSYCFLFPMQGGEEESTLCSEWKSEASVKGALLEDLLANLL